MRGTKKELKQATKERKRAWRRREDLAALGYDTTRVERVFQIALAWELALMRSRGEA